MKKTTTMKDIAEALNISIVSVSKALNNKEGVGRDLRKKILQTAKEMGYKTKVPFKAADENTKIGIIIPDYFLTPSPAFYWSLYEELVTSLKKQGYYSIFEIINPLNNKEVPYFLKNNDVEGIIVIGYVSHDYLVEIEKYDIPLIMMDFYDENIKGIAVMPDNSVSCHKITSYLLNCGHTKIGFVGNVLANTNIMDRYLGYHRALLENNIELRYDWIISDRNEDMVIYDEFSLPQIMPTAFVCNSDQTAYQFVKYLLKKGYRVPQDVSVTGFYDYVYSVMCQPKLTTVKVDMEGLAESAVNILLDCIDNRQTTSGIVLSYGYVLTRDSVKVIE